MANLAYLEDGFGTTFYGKEDYWPDGSYLTTKWFVLFFILVPLCSLRVKPIGTVKEEDGAYTLIKDKFVVYSKRRPSLKQVVFTYLFTIGLIPYVCFIFYVLKSLFPQEEPDVLVSLGFLPAFCWFLLPWVLRRRSRKKSQILSPSEIRRTSQRKVDSPLSHLTDVEDTIKRNKGKRTSF